MNAHPDTSFLYSLYVRQAHSAAAAECLATLKEPLPVASQLRVELCNAIRHSAFRQTIAHDDALRSLAAFELDADRGLIVFPPVPWERVYAEAERLSHTYTLRQRHRSFDVLHVATALMLDAQEFLTFDESQRTLATTEGLTVKP